MEDRWVVEFRRRPNVESKVKSKTNILKWEQYNSYPTRAEAEAKVKSSRSERWPRRYEFRCRQSRLSEYGDGRAR